MLRTIFTIYRSTFLVNRRRFASQSGDISATYRRIVGPLVAVGAAGDYLLAWCAAAPITYGRTVRPNMQAYASIKIAGSV